MTHGDRLPVHFARWFVPLASALGMPPRACYLEVNPEVVVVRMGWAFRGRLPRRLISDVMPARVPWWAGVGVHWWRGWVVNGALRPLVEITLTDPVRVRVLGVPCPLRRLLVSMDQPDRLVRLLAVDPVTERPAGQAPAC